MQVTIKALACSQDLTRESSVVTKNFTVLQAEEQNTDSSGEETVSEREGEGRVHFFLGRGWGGGVCNTRKKVSGSGGL